MITESDLYGRTLMVGGVSPAALRSVQQRLISSHGSHLIAKRAFPVSFVLTRRITGKVFMIL